MTSRRGSTKAREAAYLLPAVCRNDLAKLCNGVKRTTGLEPATFALGRKVNPTLEEVVDEVNLDHDTVEDLLTNLKRHDVLVERDGRWGIKF